MQEAHEIQRERDRKEIDRIKAKAENEAKIEVQKEIKRMKEILG